MKIKLAVFDMAGTTVEDNNGVARAFRRAFVLHGYHVEEEDVKPLMGYRKTNAIEMVLEKRGVRNGTQLIDEIHDDFVDEMIDYYAFSTEVKPMRDAEEVMRLLKQKGIAIMLNTGFPKVIADTIVDRLKWVSSGLIDGYIASDEVERGRPAPDMIQALMEKAGIRDAREVVKIGDTEVDVREGMNAGCGMIVAVTSGAFSRSQLEPFSPDHIIDHLAELPDLIVARG